MKTNARENPFIKVMVVKALVEISENDKYKEFILRGKLIGFEEVSYVLLKNVVSVMKIISENENKKEEINNRAVSQIIREDLKITMHRTNKGFAVILDVEIEKAKLGQILNIWRDESMSDLENLRRVLVLLEDVDEIVNCESASMYVTDDIWEELIADLRKPIQRMKARLHEIEVVKLEIIQNTWDENAYHS